MNDDNEWIVGGGELGALICARDWTNTPLGPLESWPRSLRMAVGMLLPSRAQIALFWGPQFAVLYNDAYRPVFGDKHPHALGLPGREAWSEIWEHQLRPLLEGVVRTGRAYWASDLLFCLQRHGYLEETYFDISYDPIRGESGAVEGVYCIVTETTGRVVGERRLRALSSLGHAGARAATEADVFESAARVLAEFPEEFAFAALYDWDAAGQRGGLRACAGIEAGVAASLSWPFEGDLPAGGMVLEGERLAKLAPLPGGRWPEPCTRVAILPIALASQPCDGFLVAGLSPRRAPDAAYGDFFTLVAAAIGNALANAKALEAERRRAASLAELDRAKTAFFSNVSHEFRTPLTLLLGPLREELEGGRLPAASAGPLQVAYRNGTRLLKLVNTLLDFSRIEAGRMQARFEAVDLAAITAELASNFESACEAAGLVLQVHCEREGPRVFVDRDMWEKIVLNLLSNAFKFTFEGSISVDLSFSAGSAVLTVSDTGSGIAAHEMPRLFERFHRIEGTRARTHEGSGIGLAMVQELVRMHGGQITATSEPGRGSAFEVRLPLGSAHLPADLIVAPDERIDAPRHAPVFVEEALGWLRNAGATLPDTSPGPGRRERILVADDNADMREYIGRLLREHWEVVAVPDGDAAMHALFTARFDLLLADVMMPGMDGFRLLRAIRSEPALREMPVVLLSARAGEEARIDGRDSGADDYLTKPFSARELLAQVRAHLATARARRLSARERELMLAAERAARMDAQRQWEDLAKMFEQAHYPIVMLHGRDHTIEFANPAACTVWGRLQADVMHKPLFEALPEIRGQGLEALLETVFETGEPVHGRQLAVRLDRGRGLETVYFDFVYSPLRAASGRVEGIAVTATDVTAQVAARVKVEATPG